MTQTKRINACCKTDLGLRRLQNEDVCSVDTEQNFFMVADGMGGAAQGEVASALFLKTTQTLFAPQTTTIPSLKDRFLACFEDDASENQLDPLKIIKEKIESCFETTNAAIQDHIEKNPSDDGMGCTAELLTFFDQQYIIGHIGDSRSYLLSPNAPLKQLTTDHSLVQRQIDAGTIQQSQAESSAQKNVLTRAIGVSPKPKVDIISGQAKPGDIFLLCSDGLFNMITDEAIHAVLVFDAPLTLKAEMLIGLANDNGGHDNISVTLVEVLR